MASLYRRPNSAFWWIVYSDAGRMIRESTKVRHLNRKTPPEDAVLILRTIESRIARQKFGIPIRATDALIEDWHAEYCIWHQAQKRPKASTWYYQERATRAFIAWAKSEHVEWLSEVNSATLARYFNQRKTADKTRKNEVSWWLNVWERAKAQHRVSFDRNPWEEFQPGKVESVERRPFTEKEYSILLEEASPDWVKFAVWIGFYTGERLSAILNLRVADFMGDVIRFQRTKQERIRYVYCPAPLQAFLKTFKPAGETWLQASTIRRNQDGGGSTIYKMFTRLRKNHPGLFVGVSFHCLRHTYTSRLANSGMDRAKRMEIMDHSTITAHARYVHEEAEKARAFGQEIEKAFT